MAQRRQGKLRRKRQRRKRRAWIDRPVVGPIGHAARGIAQKAAFPAVDLHRLETRSVVRREAPTILAIAFEVVRIAPRVFALDINGAPAVLEIVAVLFAHEAIADAGEIDPGLGKMMDEERPGIEKLAIVDVLPLDRSQSMPRSCRSAADGRATPDPERREWSPRHSPPSHSAEIRFPASIPAARSLAPPRAHCQSTRR